MGFWPFLAASVEAGQVEGGYSQFALRAGTFGPRFAWRFSLATFVVAIASAGLVGWRLL